MVLLLLHGKRSSTLTITISFWAKIPTVARFAVDFAFSLTKCGRLQSLVAMGAGEASALVPGRSSSHHFFGHVYSLATSRARVCTAKLWLVRSRRPHLGRHVGLCRGWNVASRWSILVAIASVHGENASASTVAIALGSKQFAVARLTVHLLIVLRAVGAVQAALAIGANEAHFVPCLAQSNLLFGKVDVLVAPWTNSWHCRRGLRNVDPNLFKKRDQLQSYNNEVTKMYGKQCVVN